MKFVFGEIKAFFHSLLSVDGISSKRAVGLMGMLSLIILMFWNVLACNDGAATLALIDAVLYTTIAALFGTSIEKIWPQKKI